MEKDACACCARFGLGWAAEAFRQLIPSSIWPPKGWIPEGYSGGGGPLFGPFGLICLDTYMISSRSHGNSQTHQRLMFCKSSELPSIWPLTDHNFTAPSREPALSFPDRIKPKPAKRKQKGFCTLRIAR